MKARWDSNHLGLITLAYIAQLFYVVVGRYAMNNITVAGYDLIYHPAVSNRRELLFKHPLIIAIISGVILGILPLRAIAAVFGRLSKVNENWTQSWQKTKLWIAIPFVFGFLLTVSSYVANAPAGVPSGWRSFFAAPCALDAAHLLIYRNGCANQLLFTAPLICALIYSLTVFVDPWRYSAGGREPLSVASGTTGQTI